jgi:hypothetical protein
LFSVPGFVQTPDIGEVEIRLVLQTIGRDVVVSPSIRLPAISMGRMSFAFSRSIFPTIRAPVI